MVKCLECGVKMIAKKNLMGSNRCACWNLCVDNYEGIIEARVMWITYLVWDRLRFSRLFISCPAMHYIGKY